jgi:hypothetical protein
VNISEYKYKVETHTHTSPMSPCADFKPTQVIKKYAENDPQIRKPAKNKCFLLD